MYSNKFWYDAIHKQCREFTDFFCPICSESISVPEIPATVDQVSFDCWDVSAVSSARFDQKDPDNFCHPANGLCMTSTYAYHLSNQNQGVIGIIRGCANTALTDTQWEKEILKPPFHKVDTSLTLASRGSAAGDIKKYTVYTPPMETKDIAKSTALKVIVNSTSYTATDVDAGSTSCTTSGTDSQ